MAEKIKDYATGKKVQLTPEEQVRQQFEHILIDEWGYPKGHINIEFPIQGGSASFDCDLTSHSFSPV